MTTTTRLLTKAWPCALLYLLLACPGLALAQSPAPPWELATSGSPTQLGTSLTYASAVDAHGNVFVTGQFSSTVVFGNTVLTSKGGTDLFVAKWDATAQAFTWATSGGGIADDRGRGIAVSGTGVFVTGFFNCNSQATIAGQSLNGAGTYDVFVAKYVDTSTGSTPATSSFANAWATSGGGTDQDEGTGIAVNGTSVYVTGYFASGRNTYIAGQSLPGTGPARTYDMFVAKYVDTSTGSTPATSSFANAWATSGGGTSDDYGQGVAVSGTGVFVVGNFTSSGPITIAGQVLTGAGAIDVFVAKYVDTSTGSTPATSSFANGWATSGGGTSDDRGQSIAVSGTGVFVTGSFSSGYNTVLAGQALAGTGVSNGDIFIAKYVDTSSGSTPATSGFAPGWAISAGGRGDDQGNGIAVRGTNVFVTGYFTSGNAASIAGQILPGAGGYDMFVAKYVDMSTGNTPTTSSVTNGWASSGGGAGDDFGLGASVSGQQVYTVGKATPPATFGSLPIGTPMLSTTGFLARLTDATLAPLPVRVAALASASLALYPSPTRTSSPTTLTGAAPATVGQVLDALGRRVAAFLTTPTGAATLPTGLAPGLYVVRVGAATGRWVVE